MSYTLDLDKCKNLPACRGQYTTGTSYCALGKLFVGLGLPVPTVTEEGIIIGSSQSSDFIVAVGKAINDLDWISKVTNINDSKDGNLRDNHERAFRLAYNTVMESGLVTLAKTSEPVLSNDLA